MNFNNRFFILIILSFFLLTFSLYLSYSNISDNNKIIKYIEKTQIKMFYLTNKLNYDIKMNQTNILQMIVINEKLQLQSIQNPYIDIHNTISKVNNFAKKINIKGFDEILDIIKKRLVSYDIVKDSLLSAIKLGDNEDIYDALIGFNQITIKFSKDTNKLITIANTHLDSNILGIQEKNNTTTKTLVFSFLIAFMLISFSIYKINTLNKKISQELNRAENAEKKLKKLQEQLLRYNEDLENEITVKSKELQTKMYTHFLSGLDNRNKLFEDTEIYHFKQLALLNIDKFQKFNDVYGEELGNIALQLSAKFLQEQIDEDIRIYHLGGDEFVYAVDNIDNLNNELFTKKIEIILANYSKENFIYEDKIFHFVMSAGIAFGGKKKILAYADMALKDAKKKNIQLAVFNVKGGLRKTHQEDIECHKKLISAFKRDALLSYFQPIVPIQDDQKEIKYESLVRLMDEDGTIIPPFNFIKVARQNRLYDKLTDQVVKNTIEVITKYQVPCSLNISMTDIENEKTISMLFDTFEKFKYNNLLTIELLETEEFKNYQIVYDFCIKVKSFGVKIALDDFGSGYSNFTHILHLPIDFIKIDASLISNIDKDQHSQIMVETIVGLASKLGISTIAEFVSSQKILNVVKKLNVDYAQGYYTGKPEKISTHLPFLPS